MARHDEKGDVERESQAKTSQSASACAVQAKLAVTVLSISLAKGEPQKCAMEETFFLPSEKNVTSSLQT